MAIRLPGRLHPKRIWNRLLFRNVDFKDNHAAFRAAYLVPDPYDLKSARAAYRFGETNRIIRDNFGRPSRLLEIGCAEGYQSRALLDVCDRLHGIDVSARAVERARARCPSAQFSVGDVHAVEGGYDLVVAAEVLYYLKDVPAALRRMNSLGSACLATYYQPYADRLDGCFEAIPNVEREILRFRDAAWTAVWWRAAGGGPP